jgi:hypothetical protein
MSVKRATIKILRWMASGGGCASRAVEGWTVKVGQAKAFT